MGLLMCTVRVWQLPTHRLKLRRDFMNFQVFSIKQGW
jgi:hypothetical protein